MMILKMMEEEQLIKLKTQACSAMVNFVRGLIDEEAFQDESSDTQKEYARILDPYATPMVATIGNLF